MYGIFLLSLEMLFCLFWHAQYEVTHTIKKMRAKNCEVSAANITEVWLTPYRLDC